MAFVIPAKAGIRAAQYMDSRFRGNDRPTSVLIKDFMQININGKGIDLTDAIKDYAEKKISSLDKFYDRIIRAHVTVGVESHHHQKGDIFVAECKLEVPGKDLFASKEEKTLYKAIDKVRDYLEGELKKHKDLNSRDKTDREAVRDSKEYQAEEE